MAPDAPLGGKLNDMDAARYEQLAERFARARSLAAAERAEFIRETIAEDAELGRELAAMCSQLADESSSPFGDHAIQARRAELEANGDSAAGTALPFDHVGPYRLVRRIGQGGMGTVFEARQESPRRRVALKVMHPSFDAKDRHRRFQLEGELLGRLQHPGIAQIYECGVTDAGHGAQPWLAMEFVEGTDLLSYCERERLDGAQRLTLLAMVADAVQHAHERGVVHRDLKPDNVLVDATGRPRVLDFGVARATDTTTQFATMLTRTGELVGTLAYMAPEQLGDDGDAITPRTDVYALGVMLYQLLSLRLPHDVVGLPLAAAIERLARIEPPSLARLDTQWRGEVATIVQRAMEKEPGRRYESAAALAADIRRHLAHEPITARPASAVYLLRKLVRRNRGVAISLALVFATLVTGIVVTTLQANEAQAAAHASSRQAYSANLQLADAAIGQNQFAAAKRSLEAAPPELRDWEWRVLAARLDNTVRSQERALNLPLHEWTEPLTLRFAPDATSYWLIGAGSTFSARRFRASDGAVLEEAPRGDTTRNLWKGALSADGERLFVIGGSHANDEHHEWLGWNFDAGKREWTQRSLAAPDPRSYGIPMADGSVVWVGVGSARIEALDGSTRTIADDHTPRYAFADAAGRRLAISDGFGAVSVRDTASLAIVASASGQSDTRFVAFSPDGRCFATCSSDATVKVWEIDGVPSRCVATLEQALEVPTAVFSPDGKLFATLTIGRIIQVFSTATWTRVGTFGSDALQTTALAFVGPREVASVAPNGSLRVFSLDGQNTQVVEGHTRPVIDLEVLPGAGVVVTAAWDGLSGHPGSLRLWDQDSGDLVVAALGPDHWIGQLASDGRVLAMGVYDSAFPTASGELWLLDTERGCVRRFPLQGYIQQMCFVAGSRSLLIFGSDGARRFDVTTGAETPQVIECGRAHRAACSPDGTTIAIVSRTSNQTTLVDSATMRERWSIAEAAACVAFSPDGRRLATGGADSIVRLWDVETGAPIAAMAGHDLGIYALAFHPDGKRLASGGADQVIRLWDLATFEPVGRLTGHTDDIQALAFHGDQLWSGSGDNTARVWEPAPVRTRLAAKRARQAALARVEPLVAPLFAAAGADGEHAMTAVSALPDLGDAERRVARQLVLRHVLELASRP